MVIVVITFAMVFLYRDVYVLSVGDRRTLMVRLAGYTALLLAGLMIMSRFGRYAWTGKRFALAAVAVQLAELGIALALRKWEAGRHCWIGCILPFPAFLVILSALSFSIKPIFPALPDATATQIVTGSWLILVAALAALLSAKEEEEESIHRRFVNDFALLTSCTAFIFVPYGFF